MNNRDPEEIIKEKYGQEVLDCMRDITGSINNVISQIHKILKRRHLENLGSESYYTAFSCTLKTAFCDFFIEAVKNKSREEIILNTDTLLQDAREYMFKRLKE